MKKQTLSVVINTKNAQATLGLCLDSVSFADEIILVDMNSSDDTVKIAKKYTDKIFNHPDVGYADPARDFALGKASGDWILVVDADEEISERLQEEIVRLINIEENSEDDDKESKIDVYKIPRKNIVFNKEIKHAGWWPDYQIRLFRNGKVSWKVGVHRQPDTTGNVKELPAKDEFAIIHHNYQKIDQFISRLNRYTSLQSKEKSLSNIDTINISSEDIFKSFSNEFFKRYFLYEGNKDGVHGMSISLLQSCYELSALLKQWEISGFKEKDDGELGIKSLRSFQKDINYWIADYNVEESSGLKQLYWKMRRKFKK